MLARTKDREVLSHWTVTVALALPRQAWQSVSPATLIPGTVYTRVSPTARRCVTTWSAWPVLSLSTRSTDPLRCLLTS